MSPQTEPTYRTEYETTGKHVCPETGKDLSGYTAAGVRAHIEDIFPESAHENFSEEAKARRAILQQIAKEKD